MSQPVVSTLARVVDQLTAQAPSRKVDFFGRLHGGPSAVPLTPDAERRCGSRAASGVGRLPIWGHDRTRKTRGLGVFARGLPA